MTPPDNGPTTIDAERASGVAITELLAGFMQELRQAGLPVSLTENHDAMEGVKHIPIEDSEDFKYALAATLVQKNTHWRACQEQRRVWEESVSTSGTR